MHFRVQMKIRLKEPLSGDGVENVRGEKADVLVGYFLTMKVNAKDVTDAATLAQAIALAPPDKEGKDRSFDGIIEEAVIETIEPDDWPEHTRPLLAPAEQRGVYYSTGLMFFAQGQDQEEAEDDKRWWQFWRK